MKPVYWLISVGLIMSLAWAVTWQADQISDTATKAARVVYTKAILDPQMAKVATTFKNLPYCDSTDPQQRLDLYVPKNASATPYPLVVYVHGGGWHSGDKTGKLLGYYAPSLASQGIAVASINYRLAPSAIFPAQNDDVACALSFLRDSSAKYNLDPGRLTLFGDSAGAELVTYATLADQYQIIPWHNSLKGVVDFYGLSDLTALAPGGHLDKITHAYLGSGYAQNLTAASPLTYRPAQTPPFLIVHGTKDSDVPIAQSQALADRLLTSGPVTLVSSRGAGHGFSSRGRPSADQIRTQVVAFIHQALTQ